ncbi:hypothetical protein ZEAMMB73_Zm00001d051858 [Zea mays]|uniref:Uncharacterized protein n=1 Tax=Zea mays TaxID=4577 RepID=A0A1D6QAD4_MAIZE|nr:hypothetical protein ZEAMMB73_Zm00001d051858 [Zea mays]
MGSSANQAATLADVVRAVGEQLIAANPIGKCFSIFFIVVSCYPVGCYLIICVGFQVVFGVFKILFPNQTPTEVVFCHTLVAIILVPSVSPNHN